MSTHTTKTSFSPQDPPGEYSLYPLLHYFLANYILFHIIYLFLTIYYMAGMTKSALMSLLADTTGMSKKDVAGFMDTLAQTAYKEVKKNGMFVLPGFGKMVKMNRAARMGRNPATGEQIKIAAKTVVKFRLAKAAKEAVL